MELIHSEPTGRRRLVRPLTVPATRLNEAPVPRLDQPESARLLEVVELHQPMHARLLCAAERLEGPGTTQELSPTHTLRQEQAAVFADFAHYLTDVATRPDVENAPPFCRIVLPPRTGKTVIAGHIIGRAALTTAFVVPTRTLVSQTVRELTAMLPGVPIGVYCGEEKRPVEHGVNVLTYAMFRRSVARNELPTPIARAALVFVDEGHHAMTAPVLRALRFSFTRDAVRIALTATPDFNDQRRLEQAFPDLVHQLSLAEALELELLAPLRVWVAEVDADGSQVSFVAGDFDPMTLGRLMSSAPFFSAMSVFRYGHGNAALPALVACATRQQATDLLEFLTVHRPAHAPRPGLILAETARDEREALLAGFERGEIDTLIQVGVLLEGWSSPRCKLLIDLAPSLSQVRATQKFFRVMTRHGDAEARIFMLLPRDLPYTPILPMELFGTPGGEYTCGALLTPGHRPSAPSQPVVALEQMPVAGVKLKKRILLTARLEKPTLDACSVRDIRRVVESAFEFERRRPPRFARFRWLIFRHRRFTGRGDFLLRYLGYPATRDGYHAFLARVYPAVAGEAWLEERLAQGRAPRGEEVRRHLTKALNAPGDTPGPSEPWASTWRAARGAPLEPVKTPEELLLEQEAQRVVVGLMEELKPRDREILTTWAQSSGTEDGSLAKIGAAFDLCSQRIRQVTTRGFLELRIGFEFRYLRRAERAGRGIHGRSPGRTGWRCVRTRGPIRVPLRLRKGVVYPGNRLRVREILPSTVECYCGHHAVLEPRALRRLRRESWVGRRSIYDPTGHQFVYFQGELEAVVCSR